MIYDDTSELACEYGQKAMGLMKEREVSPTPNNYVVWYTHVANREPELSRMISTLEDNNQEFTKAVCADIFNKFFSVGVDDESLHETATRIENELSRILGYVEEAGDGAAEYGKSLASAEGEIKGAKDAEGLKSAISQVMAETHKMEGINKTLESRLAESTEEVGQLRDDLEEMRKEALTDSLTGIANRKLFDMELRRQARDAMETGDELSLLMLDIDLFKKFNDAYGHQTGDQVLKLLASTMNKTVKGTDIPARYGGEEFSVILPGTNLEGAMQIAENIRHRVSSKTLINRSTNKDLGKLTVSIGAGQYVYGETLPDLIKRTDQALYRAKDSGRNCVKRQTEAQPEVLDFGG